MPFTFTPASSPESANSQSQGGFQASFGSQASQLLSARPGEENSFSLVQLVLFVICGATALVTVALLAYSFFLSSQVESKKAELLSIEEGLNQLPLNDMRQVSNRIKIITQLIKEHPSVNVAFKIVEASVENQIFYDKFDLRYVDQSKSYLLQLNAVAPNYRAVAQQIDTLKREPYSRYLARAVIDGLGPDESGRINFSLRTPISITGILTEELVLSEEPAPIPPVPFQVVSSSTQPLTGTSTSPSASSTGPVVAPNRTPAPQTQ